MNTRGNPSLDQALLERVRKGDRDARNIFFKTFIDRVYGYALTLVRDPELAGDIVQNSFLRMHRALGTLDPERDPSAWVFTVVTNTVRDHWRTWEHRNRGRIVDVDELWNQAPQGSGPDVLNALGLKETQAGVHKAMERLSPSDREIILLKTFEGLSTEELAGQLKVSVDAVRQRHSRAVRRLGKIYKETTGEDQVAR